MACLPRGQSDVVTQTKPTTRSNPQLPAQRSPLHALKVATLNVRGLAAEYKKMALCRDLTRYAVDICALQETKIQEDLDRPFPNGLRLICFKPLTPARGLGFLVGRKLSPFLHRAWQNERTERIAVATFRLPLHRSSRFIELRFVNAYGPTSPAAAKDPSERDKFYDLLVKQVASFNDNRGCTIVAGDFNARVGKKQDGETCIGSFGRGIRNENGAALSIFAEANSFVLTNTCFMHPMTHRTTWRGVSSTGRQLFNTIDFVLISQSMRSSLRQARSWSGLETFSDHAMVSATLDLKYLHVHWAAKKQNTRHFRLCIENLREKKQTFVDAAGRKWMLRKTDDMILPQQKMDALKECLLSTAEEVLGKTQRRAPHIDRVEELSKEQKKLRMQIDGPCSSEKRAELRRRRNVLLRQIHKVTHESALRDIDNRVAEIEAAKDNMQVFMATRQVRRWRPFSRVVVHDKDEHIVRNPKEAACVIAKHFEQVFNPSNGSAIQALSSFVGPPRPLDVPITVDETKMAIAATKSGRAPGPDNLPAELLKATADMSAPVITSALNDALQLHLPLELGAGILVPLPKPHKQRGPVANLRPVFLLLTVRKVLTNIVLKRVRGAFERKLPLHQAAYRPGRSTADGVWVQRMCASIVEYFQVKLHKLGTDLSHAFDSVDRAKLLRMLYEDGWTTDDESRMIQMLLTNTTLTVRVEWTLSETLNSSLGVPQGDGLSGLLFIAYLAEALRAIESRVLSSVQTPSCDLLLGLPNTSSYADDVDHYSTQSESLEERLQIAGAVYPEWNLELNVAKTERVEFALWPTKSECPKCNKRCVSAAAMCDTCEHWWHNRCVPLSPRTVQRFETDPSAKFSCPACTEGHPLGNRGQEAWRGTKHLGSFLDSERDVAHRIANANAAFATLTKVWRRDFVKRDKKLLLFKAFVQPHFIYNIGVQALNKTLESRLDAAQRKLLRRAMGIFYPNKISNSKLYEIAQTQPLSKVARQSRWRLFGHLLRQSPDCPANKATLAFFRAKQMFRHRAGAKRSCLMETLRKDLNNITHVRGLQLESEEDLNVLRELAADRAQWRGLCYEIDCPES